MMLLYVITLLIRGNVAVRSIYDHSSFLLPNEVKPPTYVNVVSGDGDLNQEGYDQQILNSVAREQLAKFQVNLDAFGERLGETTFGRAELVDTRPFQLNTCCYPETALLTEPVPLVGAPANLTAIPIYVLK